MSGWWKKTMLPSRCVLLTVASRRVTSRLTILPLPSHYAREEKCIYFFFGGVLAAGVLAAAGLVDGAAPAPVPYALP